MNAPLFHPWEVPPDAKLLPASVSQVKSRFGTGASAWTVGLLQLPTSSSPLLWLSAHDEDSGFVALTNAYPYQLMQFNAEVEPVAVRLSFSHLLGQNRFARVFFLNEYEELRHNDEAAHEAIVITPDGVAAWSEPQAAFGIYYPWSFKWSEPLTNAEFLRLPSLEVWARVQQLLANEEDDSQFARQFALLSEAERHSLVFKNNRGRDEEFKSVLCDCALALWQSFWENIPYIPHIGYPDEFGLSSSFWGQLEFNAENNIAAYRVDSPPAFLEMVAKVWQWFRPINSEVAQRSAVQEWLRRDGASFEIPLSYPSAHERLEAMLRWRDWQEQHGE